MIRLIKFLTTTVFVGWGVVFTSAQSTYLTLDKDTYRQIDRVGRRGHTSVKPYRISNIDYDTFSTKIDSQNVQRINEANWVSTSRSAFSQKTVTKYFYRNKYSMLSVDSGSFNISLNPVLYFAYGQDVGASDRVSINTRGAELKGTIDNRIAFYSFVGENQIFAPQYFNDVVTYNQAIPQENFWKPFKESGYDFFTARAYIDFNLSKSISFQLGHGQNFIGDGYRSLILSNYAGNYPFAKVTTKFWKIQYTNLYAKLTADVITSGGVPAGGQIYPQKWLSLHHLSVNVFENLNIGLFESVMNGAHDSTGRSGFELDYLNPVVFYRSIEQNLGSEGNAIVGLDYKYNFLKSFQLYGQFVLDEFHLSNLMARDGWWANKQALQTGLKYFDAFGIKQLDLQLEYNFARPFMYSHLSNYTSHTNYRTPLAHPLGANFKELIGIVYFQPTYKLSFVGKMIYMKKGEDDTTTTTWGGDLNKPYTIRTQELGNTTGQGVSNQVVYLSLRTSYQLKPNLFIDLLAVVRQEDSANDLQDNTSSSISLGLRLNIAPRLYDY